MIVARAESLDVADVLRRRELVVAVATGEINAAALFSDWLVVTPEARLTIGRDATTIAALVWRLGPAAYRSYLLDALNVADAVADAVVSNAADVDRWLGRRSTLALDSAAALIRRRGGDPLERAEFARLFATGEPQEGLAAFLEKRAARFR